MNQDQAELRKVVLGITGSVAAYKSAELARLLVSRGYEVRAVLTESAERFITTTTLHAITGNSVVTSLWKESERRDGESTHIEHIALADWADAIVVAPATADFIAKMAAGFGDSSLLATILATKAPILLAPAMNVNMLAHPAVQENISKLRTRGTVIVDPEEGALACGWSGSGRLADPQEIFNATRRVLSPADLANKRIVITTGATREAIDPVRFISNRSSGKMGAALAHEAYRRGANVTLIHGPISIPVSKLINTVPVVTALQMETAVMAEVFEAEQPADIVIMAAAVSDFRPKSPALYKIKKGEKAPVIELFTSPDVLAKVGERRNGGSRPVLVGFAVETGELTDLLDELRRKLLQKQTDLMVGNFAEEAFEHDTNRVWLVDRFGRQEEVATTFKSRVANKILDATIKLL